jgi:putative methyltransferase (TIGR04325 family)
MTKDFNIWEGVYDSYKDAISYGDGFNSDRWINSNYEKTKDMIKKNKNYNLSFCTSSLSAISSLIYTNNNSLSILDFGGGMGSSFINLTSALIDNKNISFSVVEGLRSCEKGKILFKNDDRIEFLNELPKNKKYDIIYISSCLQYIEDWQGLLATLCKNYNAEYFIFDDLPSGDIEKTYVSVQNYYESKIPCTFFKLDDIIKEIKDNGYEIIYRANFRANILNTYENYPQNNFEEKYKINYGKNLIFKKKSI